MSYELKIEISEEQSAEIIEQILQQAGISYRRVEPGEEGGFFYKDKDGNRKKFTENIFIKRSLKYEHIESDN